MLEKIKEVRKLETIRQFTLVVPLMSLNLVVITERHESRIALMKLMLYYTVLNLSKAKLCLKYYNF